MGEILTVKELASLLKMTPRQIYEMTAVRTRRKQKHPLPLMRLNGNLRFSRTAVDMWLAQLQQESAR